MDVLGPHKLARRRDLLSRVGAGLAAINTASRANKV